MDPERAAVAASAIAPDSRWRYADNDRKSNLSMFGRSGKPVRLPARRIKEIA
jgi:hypothetical protein